MSEFLCFAAFAFKICLTLNFSLKNFYFVIYLAEECKGTIYSVVVEKRSHRNFFLQVQEGNIR